MIDRRIVLRRIIPVAVIGASIAVLVFLFSVVTQRMTELRQAPGDNLTWALSQTEVELLLLIEAVNVNQADETVSFKNLRRRFDNFHSRVTGITESPVFAEMRENPKFAKELTQLTNCLDFTTPLIDVSDGELRENLEFVLLGLNGVRSDVHDIALTGISLQSQSSDVERASFSRLLLFAATVSLALIFFLIVMLFFLLRQYRIHRETAAEVELAKRRLEASFQVSLDAIVVADNQGTILDFNKSAETVFGFSREEAIGAQMADLIIPEQYRDAHHAGMARFNKTKEPRLVDQGRIEISALRKSGEEFPIEISIGQAKDHRGEIFISYLRDITERLAAEEALKKARDEAVKAEKSKSNFLAVMSHEMRTPLNGIFGTMELLKKTKLTKKQNNYVDIARRSGDILLHHVNDVLDVSRLDEDKMVLNSNAFDLGTFFSDIVESNAPLAEKVGNKLVLDFGDVQDAKVIMDEQRLRQIVYNLVSNALKFTHEGNVTVFANTHRSDLGEDALHIEVKDDGIGIAAEEQGRIFERFYTKEDAYDRMASGAGLGLAICKQIVDLMGGKISVESELGVGTTFKVELPVAFDHETVSGSAPDAENLGEHNLQGVQVLLVEDNEINRMIVCEMLRSEGILVDEAENGQEAVEKASEQEYDVLLMDISMPIMNGIDATIEIRSRENPNKNKPILALTAHALAEEQAKFLSAGMNATLDKPVSQTTLLKTLAEFTQGPFTFETTAFEAASDAVLDAEVFGGLKAVLKGAKLEAMVAQYEEEIDSLLQSIPSSPAPEALAEIAKLTHKSVGSSGMIGLIAFQKDLRSLEQAAKANKAKEASVALQFVKDNWPKTREALRAAC